MRADYIHSVEKYKDHKVIVIEDLNLGNKSVTNDIENVVKDIEIMEKIEAKDCLVVYKDSEGTFDGWNAKLENFVYLGQDNWQSAADTYINRISA